MAILFFSGPADPDQAQARLEALVRDKLGRLDRETCPKQLMSGLDKELGWIADNRQAQVFLLLDLWVKLLRQNQMAWWCELPMTPAIGWILGILQACPQMDSRVVTEQGGRDIAFIASGMAEHLIVNSLLHQPSPLVDPTRYVPIRWNCQWSKKRQERTDSSILAELESQIVCTFYRYDGLRRLEQLEHATNIKRRTESLQESEIQQAVREHQSSGWWHRQQDLLAISWLQQDCGESGDPNSLGADILQELFRWKTVSDYLEALALAEFTAPTQAGGDPYLFFLDHADNQPITYRSPDVTADSGKRWRVIDRLMLIEQGLTPGHLQWMQGLRRLFSAQYLRGIGEIIMRTDYYRRNHPQDWRRVMEAKEKELECVEEDLKTAMELVESTAMSLQEYRRRVDGGRLADYEAVAWGMGDRAFRQLNPAHPLAEQNRMCRIAAADRIRDVAAQRATSFPEAALGKIHYLLFDCCGSVRHSLAIALYHAGKHSSVAFLEQLLEEEPNSAIVRETAEVAALRCDQRESGCKNVPMGAPAIAVVSKDVNLVIQLNRLAKEANCRLIFPEPNTPDLYVFPAVLRIVDRRVLGGKAWNWYLKFLEELMRPFSASALEELSAEGIRCEEFATIEPPMILTDGILQEEEEAWGTLPTAGPTVFRAEEWMDDWILNKAREIIANYDGKGRNYREK